MPSRVLPDLVNRRYPLVGPVSRRHLLAGLATAGAAGAAGCFGRGRDETATGAGVAAGPPPATRVPDDLPVPESALHRGANRDAIPAVVDPAFAADWSEVELVTRTEFGVMPITPRLADFDRVVGVVRDGVARAYPLRVLDWHEVVNDDLGGPLLVTFCPLCGSAVVADRVVEGAPATFGVSGLLWRDNLVLYDDRTDSLWSQVAGTAIRGPLAGTALSLLPASLTTWRDWRASHPDTEVLLPPPFSNTVVGRGAAALRDYTYYPYAGYEASDRVGVSGRGFDDDRLHPKTEVLGVAHGGTARAYPLAAVTAAPGGVVTDAVGGLPVVVTVAGGTLTGYVRRVAGETRRATPAGPAHLRLAGSRWERATGRAVDGPHAGASLRPATAVPPLFWFSWLDFHPETSVYGVD